MTLVILFDISNIGDSMDNMHFTMILAIIIFVVTVILLLANISTGKNIAEGKKKLRKNNKIINDNQEVFDKMFDSYSELRSKFIKRITISLLVTLIVGIIFAFVFGESTPFPYIILIVVAIVFVFITSASYSSTFKNEIIGDIIKQYDRELEYYPNGGISGTDYRVCRFREYYDIYHAEDLIINRSKKFEFSDIHLEEREKDSEGHTHYETVYRGSFAKMEIKNINCKIFLGSYRDSIFGNNNFEHIDLESERFNKLFYAYTDNELLAYQILTPDVMEKFVALKENFFTDLDIRIIDNYLYMRFLTGDSFIPSLSNPNEEKENILESIAVLEEVIKTMDSVKTIIESKNIK